LALSEVPRWRADPEPVLVHQFEDFGVLTNIPGPNKDFNGWIYNNYLDIFRPEKSISWLDLTVYFHGWI